MEALVRHFLNFDALWRARFVLGEGALGSLTFAAATLVAAPLVGILVLALQGLPVRGMRTGVEWFIDVMRAFPLLVLLVLSYYLLLPLLGLQVQPFTAALVAFAMKHGVFFAEIYRGGWLSVDKGQSMAAAALGLSRWQIVRLVIVPQMVPVMLPSLASQATLVMRDLPLAFVIGYFEVLTSARAAQVFTRNSTPLVGAVVGYCVVLLVFQMATSRLERAFARGR
jgi:polar amino acid transport system permease protein